jgi:ribosomal protein L35
MQQAINEQISEENVEQLKKYFEHYIKQYKFTSSRKVRCETLMRRHRAKKWSQQKTSKMVRRLMVASKEINEIEVLLDQLQTKLSQAGIEIDVVSRKANAA